MNRMISDFVTTMSSLRFRRWALVVVAMLFLLSSAHAAPLPLDPEADFAAAYTLELSGQDLGAVIEAYRGVAAGAGTNTALAARAWWRIGVCERLREQWGASREAWRTLIARYPDVAPLAEKAHAELREMDRMLERVSIAGQVVDADGRSVAQAVLLIGEGRGSPPVLADAQGRFAVQRRAIQSLRSALRYVLVYAEHPELEQAAVQALILTNASVTNVVVRLHPTVAVSGRVTEASGRPLAGARVTVQATDLASGIELPYDAVLPDVMSDSNGVFVVPGVVEGLPVHVSAEGVGYRRAGLDVVPSGALFRPVELALAPIGRVGIEGVVTDDRGQPLDAVVSAYEFTVDEPRVASTRTDLSGSYRLVELPDSPISVLAESAGYGERRVTGIRPGHRRVDFVLGRPGPPAPQPVAPGEALPLFDVIALNAASLTSGSLRHHVTLFYFWSRPRPINPPALLEDVQRRYADAGVRVVCLHDASALPEDLALTTMRQGISYTVAIDRYAPVDGTGVTQSATFDAFGVRAGDALAIDPQGLVAWRGRLHDPASQTELETVLAGLVSEQTPFTLEPARRGIPAGMPVSLLQVRWVRGDPVSGVAPRDDELRGHVVVYHFGSAFSGTPARDETTPDPSAIQVWSRLFARESVLCVWVLPTGENTEEATRAALLAAPDAMVAVDVAGETYRAFGARETPGNTIVDGNGCVWADGCRDEQVVRAVKQLLPLRGRLRD